MSRGAFDTTGIAVAMALVVGFALGGLLGANASRSARRELAAARDSLRTARPYFEALAMGSWVRVQAGPYYGAADSLWFTLPVRP